MDPKRRKKNKKPALQDKTEIVNAEADEIQQESHPLLLL